MATAGAQRSASHGAERPVPGSPNGPTYDELGSPAVGQFGAKRDGDAFASRSGRAQGERARAARSPWVKSDGIPDFGEQAARPFHFLGLDRVGCQPDRSGEAGGVRQELQPAQIVAGHRDCVFLSI